MDTVVNAIGGKTAAATLSYADAAKIVTTATGVDVTGNVVVSGTVDGVDIAARDAILTSTTATADAALPKAGGTMTGVIAGFESTGIDDNASSTAMTLDSSGNVGIGVASPSTKLDIDYSHTNTTISSPANAALRLQNTNAGADNYLTALSFTTSTTGVGSDSVIASVSESAGNSALTFWTDTSNGMSEKVRIDSSGNVGIGTSSPASALDVSGTVTADGLTVDYNTGLFNVDKSLSSYSAANGVYLNGNSGGWLSLAGDGSQRSYIRVFGDTASTPDLMVFNTADAERMRISASGNVGIGVSSPTATLDVNGTIKLDGNYPVGTGSVALGDTALDSVQSAGTYNTAIGHNALTANTTATNNTSVGAFSLGSNTTGEANTAVGLAALDANTTGSYNVGLGRDALGSNTTASNNTAVGYQAGYANTADKNVFVGTKAGLDNTSGRLNTFVGNDSGANNTTAASNTFIGQSTAYTNTTGQYNTAVGDQSLFSNTTASSNTAVGYQALYSQTTASTGQNLGIGYQAGYTTNGFYNTFLGYISGKLSTGNQNTFLGHGSGNAMTSGSKNTILGMYTGNQGGLDIRTSSNNIVLSDGDGNPRVVVDSSGNVGIGTTSPTATLDVNGTIKLDGNYPVGTANVALGDTALDSLTSGAYNTAIGPVSLTANTSGSSNNALGWAALGSNNTGSSNTAVGHATLGANTTGSYNTAYGQNSLNSNTTASNNTAVGYQAGYSNTTATGNTAVGYLTLDANTTGAVNTAIGSEAGGSLTTGNFNTFVGHKAGTAATTGSNNTFVGGGKYGVTSGAGSLVTTGSNNSILGAYNGNQNGLDIRTSSNNIVLSDGDGNPRVYVNNVGRTFIGTTSTLGTNPARLEVYTTGGGGRIIQTKTDSNGNTNHLTFNTPSGQAGQIYTNTLSTTYSTSSDYRLKENVVELTGATDRLKQLNPSRFNFIADADTTVDGFLAHEVQSVVPEAISGTHNEVDADGNPVYQGIDQSKLVPLLVATIQELEARITALEGA